MICDEIEGRGEAPVPVPVPVPAPVPAPVPVVLEVRERGHLRAIEGSRGPSRAAEGLAALEDSRRCGARVRVRGSTHVDALAALELAADDDLDRHSRRGEALLDSHLHEPVVEEQLHARSHAVHERRLLRRRHERDAPRPREVGIVGGEAKLDDFAASERHGHVVDGERAAELGALDVAENAHLHTDERSTRALECDAAERGGRCGCFGARRCVNGSGRRSLVAHVTTQLRRRLPDPWDELLELARPPVRGVQSEDVDARRHLHGKERRRRGSVCGRHRAAPQLRSRRQ